MKTKQIVGPDDPTIKCLKRDAYAIYNWLDQIGRLPGGKDLLPPMNESKQNAIQGLIDSMGAHMKKLNEEGKIIE